MKTKTSFKPGCKRPPGAGRRPGTPNRFTTLKQKFDDAYWAIGGDEAFAAWAKAHQTQYYTLLAKMLPNRVENSPPERPDLSELSDEQLMAIIKGAEPVQEADANSLDEIEKRGLS